MFDRFGEFDSVEELNSAAAGLKAEGDIDSLKELAKENGISEDEVEDYVEDYVHELASPIMAALGKIKIEEKALNAYEIMKDWIYYIKSQCAENEQMARAVRKKGKSIKGCIAELLKWSFNNQYTVPDEIIKAAGIKAGRCTLGIPGMQQAKKIINKYYLEE